MKKIKLALFGGTFDPVHLGHTKAAYAACKIICADKVVFIPAKRSALKESAPAAGDKDRLAMLLLAIKDYPEFVLSDYEVKKQFPSFTLHTVRWFREQYGPQAAIHWLLGADSVKDLPLWYEIKALIDECVLNIMLRPGYDASNLTRYTELLGKERVEKLQKNVIETPLIDISSSQIRRLLADGHDVSEMLDPSVAQYIRRNNLYCLPDD